MTVGVYTITNIKTSQVYVGSSKNIENRFKQHKLHLSKGKHHSSKLQMAWNEHGEDAFIFRVLEEVEESMNLADVEQQFIDYYKAWQDYNVRKDANRGGVNNGNPNNPQCPECDKQSRRKRVNQDGSKIYDCACGWSNSREPKLSHSYLQYQKSRKRKGGSRELYANDYKLICYHAAIEYLKQPEQHGSVIDLSIALGGKKWMYSCDQLIKDLKKLIEDSKFLKIKQPKAQNVSYDRPLLSCDAVAAINL